jgi:hypothetical protein
VSRPPEIPARDLEPGDAMPRTAPALVAFAEAHGWKVRTTYAKGWTAPVYYTDNGPRAGELRKASALVESVAVRVRRGITGAYALWIDGRFAWAGSSFQTYTLSELKQMIESDA